MNLTRARPIVLSGTVTGFWTGIYADDTVAANVSFERRDNEVKITVSAFAALGTIGTATIIGADLLSDAIIPDQTLTFIAPVIRNNTQSAGEIDLRSDGYIHIRASGAAFFTTGQNQGLKKCQFTYTL